MSSLAITRVQTRGESWSLMAAAVGFVIRGLADTDRFELTLPFGFVFRFSSPMMHVNPHQLESLELSTPTKDGQS